MVRFTVQVGNVVEVPSDLLLLKFAQSFYGADGAVASRLVANGLCTMEQLRPPPGQAVVLETNGAIPSKRVLFLGTPPLRGFDYGEMEIFSRRAIEKIAELRLPVRSLTTTVHGTGYGLDGGEALQRLVKGFRAGMAEQRVSIESITFLTLGKRAERMLTTVLGALGTGAKGFPYGAANENPADPAAGRPATLEGMSRVSDGREPLRGTTLDRPSEDKRRVFVAMPFSEEFENVYEFGIYPAIRNCGLICERVDETHFTGDVLGRIKDGIQAADLVVADLTEGRPNVYLEVGYAWGRGIPVIFVARKGEKLHFDVSTHRCIFYGKFTQFARDLEDLIKGIGPARTG